MSDTTEGSESASGAPEAGGTTIGGSDPGPGAGDWTAGLSDDNRGLVEAKSYKDPNAALDALRAAESKLGDTLTLPGEDASEEETNAFYQKLGKPETAEGYQFGLPEGLPESFQYSEELATSFKGMAHKANLSATQAQAVHDEFVAMKAAEHSTHIEGLKTEINATTQGLVQEFGPANSESFKKATALADRAMKGLGIKEALVAHGVLINTGSAEAPEYTAANPEIVIALTKVGSVMFAEDTMIDGDAKSTARNPWNKGPDFNLTEQSRIAKEDPARAARLKASAIR